jgi:hypothetical protein
VQLVGRPRQVAGLRDSPEVQQVAEVQLIDLHRSIYEITWFVSMYFTE